MPWVQLLNLNVLFLVTRATGTWTSTPMANPEQVVEPMVQSSTAQNLNQRRFLHDFHNLRPDELDSLMSSSGKKNNQHHLCIKYIKPAVKTFAQVALDVSLKWFILTRRWTSFPCGTPSSWNKRARSTSPDTRNPYYMQSGQHWEIHYTIKGTIHICTFLK